MTKKAYLVHTRHAMLQHIAMLADAMGAGAESVPGQFGRGSFRESVQRLSGQIRPVLAAAAPLTCELLREVRWLIREFIRLESLDLIPEDLVEPHLELARYAGAATPDAPMHSAEWVLLQDAVKAWGYSIMPMMALNQAGGDTWACVHADRSVYGFESEAEAWLGAIAIHQGQLAVHAEALATALFLRFPKDAPKPEELDSLLKEANQQARAALEGYTAYLPRPAAQG